jgi:hypothetical protein
MYGALFPLHHVFYGMMHKYRINYNFFCELEDCIQIVRSRNDAMNIEEIIILIHIIVIVY